MRKIVTKGSSLYVGIDPGKSGYICVYDGTRIRVMWPIPYIGAQVDVHRTRKMFRALRLKGAVRAHLEEQRVFGSQGAVSAGTIMFGYAVLLASLAWSGIPRYKIVTGEEWKRGMEIPPVNFSKPDLPRRPDVPKKPKLAQHKKLIKQWRAERAPIEKERQKIARKEKVERKRLACEKAVELEPDYDFSRGPRSKKLDDGKCEAYLIACHAYENRSAA